MEENKVLSEGVRDMKGSKKICNPPANKAKKHRPKSRDGQSIRTNGFRKSLSFFPDNEDSSNNSEHSNNHGPSEANNNSNNARQNGKNDIVLTDKPYDVLRRDEILTPRLDDENASTASSCSCEDHSSVHGHSDEDPHGDLDYDDDSVVGSPNSKRTVQNIEETSEPVGSSLNETTNDHRDIQTSSSPNNLNSKSLDCKSDDANHVCGDIEAPCRRSTKIQSFINFDTGRESDAEVDSEAKVHPDAKPRESYDTLLKHFLKDACYFQMKSINHENIQISKSMGVWQTPVQNELRLNTAFRENRHVILIFSVQQSGAFQGFARMSSESSPASRPVPWILPERLNSSALSGVIKLEWLCTKDLSFDKTRDLFNAFNNNKPIKVARDGQQVEPRVGRKLCALFPRDSKKRLIACLCKLKNHFQRPEPLDHAYIDYNSANDLRSHGGFASRHRYLGTAPGSEMVYNGYNTLPSSIADHQNYGTYVRPPNSSMGSQTIFARSRLSADHLHPDYNRNRPYLGASASYQGPLTHRHRHDHSWNIDLGPVVYPGSAYHEDQYISPIGPSHYHPEFMQHPFAYQQQSSRAHYDWHHSTRGRDDAPAPLTRQRFHPYPRARR